MLQPSVPIAQNSPHYPPYSTDFLGVSSESGVNGIGVPARDEDANGVVRRWRRERRRRKVGRAYDMALEIARSLRLASPKLRVLDVGCGNGYITHHLSAMLGTKVTGIDLEPETEAPIEYRQFDGVRFPIETQTQDAVLFCYVLHHAQDLAGLLSEVRRVSRRGAQVVVYEDIPSSWWDRFVCEIHNRTWEGRTGPCTFQTEEGWRRIFESEGFEVVSTRHLSRWRNLAHPVSRRFFLMRLKQSPGTERQQ
ncbi:MAG TPA: class I SAM-dependent methyltransferase [Pyrinomonadaceae bacterium]|nr:class I SAM-dependent methyltransferase [Pyrinomonadaceae bacterium]